MSIYAILMAGGESTRMGAPKPLLEWSEAATPGRTLIEYQLQQLQLAGVDRTVVVLGHRADDVRPFVRRAGALAVINELYTEGRASSVRVGAAALGEDTEAVLLLNVDQPRPHTVIARLLEVHRRDKNQITVPVFEGKRGHPIVVAGSLLPELRQVREATQGLRAVIQRHESEVVEVSFDTSVVLLDINLPEEYAQARARYFEQVAI
jgi:molybdenum cofactor cytidylyltransferase